MICVQITRGIAPARSIKNITDLCRDNRIDHILVEGLPAYQAKNRAVEIARSSGSDLLLCEDDVLANHAHFTIMQMTTCLAFAPAKLKSGVRNTQYRKDGSLWYTGTIFCKIPRRFLDGLEFRPAVYERHGWEEWYKGESADGRGSDVHFWIEIRKRYPTEQILELPEVEHIIHEAQRGYLMQGLK